MHHFRLSFACFQGLQLRAHDALIRLDARLIERIHIGKLALIRHGHRQHVEQLAQVIRRKFRQREACVEALIGGKGILIGLTGDFQSLAHRHT